MARRPYVRQCMCV
uniref:Uncharacterized protein n=1 Tax=Anguilla anguilla TaxID=7936 RepID=A0A0E9TQ93_ANGAN